MRRIVGLSRHEVLNSIREQVDLHDPKKVRGVQFYETPGPLMEYISQELGEPTLIVLGSFPGHGYQQIDQLGKRLKELNPALVIVQFTIFPCEEPCIDATIRKGGVSPTTSGALIARLLTADDEELTPERRAEAFPDIAWRHHS